MVNINKAQPLNQWEPVFTGSVKDDAASWAILKPELNRWCWEPQRQQYLDCFQYKLVMKSHGVMSNNRLLLFAYDGRCEISQEWLTDCKKHKEAASGPEVMVPLYVETGQQKNSCSLPLSYSITSKSPYLIWCINFTMRLLIDKGPTKNCSQGVPKIQYAFPYQKEKYHVKKQKMLTIKEPISDLDESSPLLVTPRNFLVRPETRPECLSLPS